MAREAETDAVPGVRHKIGQKARGQSQKCMWYFSSNQENRGSVTDVAEAGMQYNGMKQTAFNLQYTGKRAELF